MHEVITGLLAGRPVAERETWRSLWDRLGDGTLGKEQAVALLASLTTRLPGPDTLRALIESLHERRPAPGTAGAAEALGTGGAADALGSAAAVDTSGAVNIVGTGGGPATFNISTAAAFTAAACGVRVVKTGSRAYTSQLGSVDLLQRLGVRLTSSYAETAAALGRDGIAFAGPFVYPAELTRLARTVLPLGMRPFGRFLNALGPFLAELPVAAQVTGVSHAVPLDTLRALAAAPAAGTGRRIWLTGNAHGADELLGFSDNTVHTQEGRLDLKAGALTRGDGGFAQLRPVEPEEAPAHFLAVLSGAAHPVAVDTVCLNAAALAVAAGHRADWAAAVADAREAIASGAVRALVERVSGTAAEAAGRRAAGGPGRAPEPEVARG